MGAAEIGLSPNEFLKLTPLELLTYSNGYQKKVNREAWLHGIYTMYALMSVISPILSKNGQRVFQYPIKPDKDLEPWLPSDEQKEIKEQRRRMHDYLDSVVKASKARKNGQEIKKPM